MDKCFFTGLNCLPSNIHFPDGYVSPICGKYLILDGFERNTRLFNKNRIGSFLCHNAFQNEKRYYLVIPTAYKNNFKEEEDDEYLITPITPEDIDNWYPKKFSEKIDRILLYLGEKSKYPGNTIGVTVAGIEYIFFMNNSYEANKIFWKQEFKYLWNCLYEFKYIESINNERYSESEFELSIASKETSFPFRLSSKAWERIDELQKYQENNKKVFVSMSFRDNTKNTREAIRTGIKIAGLDTTLIDEIIHNHQIVPEMFRLIRESKYLILEISDPNYGAYYEAGYALGLGKEVIVCCSEEVFSKKYETEEEKKFERYIKPHFDILQKQILVWKDYADLTKKLTEWLRELDTRPAGSNI